MGRVFNKWFWSWNLEKEEKWLREKSEEGLQLYKVRLGRYYFKEDKSVKYKYQIQLLNIFNIGDENNKYINFLEEMGVELVDIVSMWGYFRQLDNKDSFEIFSDIDSKIKHLVKIRSLFLFGLNLNILIAIINILIAIINSTRSEGKYFIFITGICIIVLIIGSVIVGRKIKKLKRERIIRE